MIYIKASTKCPFPARRIFTGEPREAEIIVGVEGSNAKITPVEARTLEVGAFVFGIRGDRVGVIRTPVKLNPIVSST